ncbi:MAG TPA: D-alanyl-D-alanine carboxypeptidase/D-alanyl-D-alanine-endopeptidase [Candidatus Acidoferrales bacterium]|nr:D-alanyl-D-alanine carboxypeptidase/D-alanyl-D-alanine-endopeptidase [Candidatus Acidoferrales bacterium]
MRNISYFSIAFIVLVVSFPLDARVKGSKSQAVLKREINFIIKRSNTPRTVKAIDIYSRRDGKNIYEFNSGFLLNPASNLKIVTASFALQNLGIDYRFRTRFIVDGIRRPNSIDGDLVAAACGDPIVSHADLDSIAGIISGSGIESIDGNLVIDASKFDSLEWGSGWMWDDEPGDYQMFIAPACLDHNTIEVLVSLDSIKHNLLITTQPVTAFVRIASTAVADIFDSLSVTRVMTNDINTISVSGKYSPYLSPSDYYFSVRHPSHYFGTVFKEMLERHNIKLRGRVVVEDSLLRMDIAGRINKAATGPGTIWTLDHSLDTVVTYVNKVSDNLGAECLLRSVPNIIYGQTGSADNGIKLEKTFLSQCGVDSTEYYIVDGSGLSHYDLITPDAIVKVLNYDLNQPYRDVFMHSLPVSGIDGTLEKRMNKDFAVGKILAKTGSISGVSTLSGYVLLPKDTLVFSMLMQNFIMSGDSIRALQDSIGTVLSLYDDNSATFVRNLKKNNAGTYWAAYEKRKFRLEEMNRNRRKKHISK